MPLSPVSLIDLKLMESEKYIQHLSVGPVVQTVLLCLLTQDAVQDARRRITDTVIFIVEIRYAQGISVAVVL